jgi:hypothetical protein
MAEGHKTKVAPGVARVVDWLVDHREEFEQPGVREESLAGAVGLTEGEVREAVDYLENHEDVVRWPQALTSPPLFVLRPGRNWPETRDEVLNKRAGRA